MSDRGSVTHRHTYSLHLPHDRLALMGKAPRFWSVVNEMAVPFYRTLYSLVMKRTCGRSAVYYSMYVIMTLLWTLGLWCSLQGSDSPKEEACGFSNREEEQAEFHH